MTILEKVTTALQEAGAMTLKEIYKTCPETQPCVIRGIINRHLKKENRLIERCHRGIYVARAEKQLPKNLISMKQSPVMKRKAILSRFKQLVSTKKAKSNPMVMTCLAAGMEQEQLSLFSSEMLLTDSEDEDSEPPVVSSHQPIEPGLPVNGCSPKALNSLPHQRIEAFDNQVFCEDSRTFLKHLPSESVDLVVTDPPYKITSRGCSGTTGGMMKTKESMKGNIFKHNHIKMSDYIPDLYRVLKEGTHCYIMTNHLNLVEMLTTAINSGFHFIKSLIWDKGNKIMGRAYMSQFEYILFFRKGKFKKINECGTSDILSVPNKKSRENGKNLHDTEKPVELMKTLIRNSSQVGDRVLDPFVGIGSTAIAAKELGRKFLANEIDVTYHDIAIKRINQAELVLS